MVDALRRLRLLVPGMMKRLTLYSAHVKLLQELTLCTAFSGIMPMLCTAKARMSSSIKAMTTEMRRSQGERERMREDEEEKAYSAKGKTFTLTSKRRTDLRHWHMGCGRIGIGNRLRSPSLLTALCHSGERARRKLGYNVGG